jgi:hypothetical protein
MAIMRNCRRIISALAVNTSLALLERVCGLPPVTSLRPLINGCVRYIVHVRNKLQYEGRKIRICRRYQSTDKEMYLSLSVIFPLLDDVILHCRYSVAIVHLI